jgi:TonB family protein
MVSLVRVTAALVLPALFASTPARASEEPAIVGEGKTLAYLQSLHGKIHPAWALNFLAMAEAQLPKDDPVNSPIREVTLEVILAPNGSLLGTHVLKSSSVPGFDASAIDVLKTMAAFPLAPEEVLSDDGNAHLYWVFARNHRQCSGITVAHKEAPLPLAMAALVKQGRDSTALARIKAAEPAERLDGLTAFTKAWLSRQASEDTPLGILAMVALALGGDTDVGARLTKVLPRAPRAAEGLAALKIPVCPLLKERLADETAENRQALLLALRYGTNGECLAFLEAVAKNKQAPVADRILAIEGLRNSEGPSPLATLRALFKETSGPVLAAAILAEARPGAGKGAVFRLTPKLRDPSLPVRAAAAAALVRVGGEGSLPQLFLMFRETDPGIYQLVSTELGKLAGKDSATMLEKFLGKTLPHIRLAGARALAGRTDEYAKKSLAEIDLGKEKNPEIRLLALTASGGAEPEGDLPLTPEARPTFGALAAGNGRAITARLLLDQFATLDPDLRVTLLGDWLATSPPKK